MKVLLVQPPVEDFYDTGIRTYPLSLLLLAAKIRNICQVDLADLRSNRKRMLKNHPFPELKTFYRQGNYTPFSLFHAYYRFGMNEKEIAQIIRELKPDLVGISSLFTTYAEEALDVARIAKDVDKGIITVMGGTHPTLFPDHCLRSPHVDYVVRGEGETPFFSLIKSLTTGDRSGIPSIPGVAFKDGDGVHLSSISTEENIDLIPERGLLKSGDYRIGKKKYTFILTSRGCPFQCSFCGKPPVPYRRRKLTDIRREIEACIDLGIEAVDFEDDMLNLDPAFFHNVLESFRDTGISLSAMNGLYAGSLDRDTLDRMYASGFRRLNFSFVDASPGVHHRQQRAFPAGLAGLLSYLELSPFLVEAHFIIGLPDQKIDHIMDTIIFLMGKRLLPGPSIYYLAPNSPLFNSAYGNILPHNLKIMRSSALYPSGPLFPRQTIFTIMKLIRFINFVKQALDETPGLGRLSDITETEKLVSKPHDLHITRELIVNKRFVWLDPTKEAYTTEPQDQSLVAYFFEKIGGRTIRGFKTMNTLTVDI